MNLHVSGGRGTQQTVDMEVNNLWIVAGVRSSPRRSVLVISASLPVCVRKLVQCRDFMFEDILA